MRRRRLAARTVSGPRWSEYRAVLQAALAEGYRLVSLQPWVLAGAPRLEPTLILRHDVDQHPASALKMAAVERELGVRSTWYFRWRTAHTRVIAGLRSGGFDVGFHYETLSRTVLDTRVGPSDRDPELMVRCRAVLKDEIAAFAARHGPISSVSAHGDSRVPYASNAALLRDEDAKTYGVEFDANEAMRGLGLAAWLTDRTAADGRWSDGLEPQRLFAEGASPILCLTHPNNWSAGTALWFDRLGRGILAPLPAEWRRTHGPIITGDDAPPH